MPSTDLQALCEQGQRELMQMNYLEAASILEQAEAIAWNLHDWDTVSRLYMPLQEAHRQKRQLCGEGTVCLDLMAQSEFDHISAEHVLEHYPQGQLLVAGWKTIAPAANVRKLAAERKLYVETFLAAVFPIGAGKVVVIAPMDDIALPGATELSVDQLISKLPIGSIAISDQELPQGPQKGTTQTFAQTMSLWERLHLPFLAQADSQRDPVRKMEGYRKTIRVDYACELAHQKLSNVARHMAQLSQASA